MSRVLYFFPFVPSVPFRRAQKLHVQKIQIAHKYTEVAQYNILEVYLEILHKFFI